MMTAALLQGVAAEAELGWHRVMTVKGSMAYRTAPLRGESGEKEEEA
jgi:hypothetical protein